LGESWSFNSTDSQDEIHAWLGLLSDGNVDVEPNCGVSVAQDYAGLVKIMLEKRKCLRLTSFTGAAAMAAKPAIEGLPSWAPDLRNNAMGTQERALYWLRPKSYRASVDEPTNAEISHDLITLTAETVTIGRIEFVETHTADKAIDKFQERIGAMTLLCSREWISLCAR